MKTMKVALLATAALAAVSVSARADDAAAIKAQLEALNARIAMLEAGPALPVGYSLLTITEAKPMTVPGLDDNDNDTNLYGDKATVISILPTADAPASTTIEWSGYVRAALVYDDRQGSDADYSVKSRGQLKVVGKTDTAVGEVGARVQLRVNADGYGDEHFISNEHWGWWAMTPELTLGGGYTGSLGNIGYGYDGACNCYITDNADVAFNPGDVTQMRLSWASGPLSFGVAIEDANGHNATQNTVAPPAVGTSTAGNNFGGDSSSLGAAAEIKYSGDAFNAEISGVWHDGGDNIPAAAGVLAAVTDDSWQAGVGAGFSLGDMASISLAAATGHHVNGQDFWGFSALASADLSDAVHAEIAYGMKEYDSGTNVNWTSSADNYGIMAGIYYDPVDQLTVGVEAEYINPEGPGNNRTIVDLVTVFRF
jgi:Porin subfamily